MDDILKEASAAVECKECPWYRNCVMPLQLAPDDMRRLKMMMEKSGLHEGESELEKAIEGMASLSENFFLQCCPVFNERLKSNPAVAQQLKKMMQSWGEGGK